jgi:hypothetical protein
VENRVNVEEALAARASGILPFLDKGTADGLCSGG